MSLTTDDDGTTVLEGPVVDQAALHGLLAKLRDIGLPLLSVTPMDADVLTAAAHRPPPPAPTPHPKETDMVTTTTAVPTSTEPRAPVDWTRKYAFATGLFYLITFAASIPAAFYFLTPGPGRPQLHRRRRRRHPRGHRLPPRRGQRRWPASPPPSRSTPWRGA